MNMKGHFSACDASSKGKGSQEGRDLEDWSRVEEIEKKTYQALEISHLQISHSISKLPHLFLSILHLIA